MNAIKASILPTLAKHRKATIAVTVLLILLFLSLFSHSQKTWYEDSDCKITGFTIEETVKGTGIYTAKGSIELKNGLSSKSVTAFVTLLDKDENQICRTVGIASDVQAGKKADFLVPLSTSSGFLGKDDISKIASYEISSISSIEGIANEAEKRG